ncbi:MAG TPA: ketoacyl-ACP synthase III [Terrimicrobiaceae bacterium]|nr:ketoacyl-ACP synthase III [Terrimicrobiaceae bacterium]
MTGIESRPVTSPPVCASDLCEDAARRLMNELNWEPESVEAVVFISQFPDYILPATACELQKRLNLSKDAACYDVNMGCSGYVYGLWLVSCLVQSGVQRALLLVGDTTNRYVNPQDKSSVYLFGEAGTATAIEQGEGNMAFVLGTDGGGVPHLIIPAGQCRERPTAANALPEEQEGGNIRSRQQLFMNGPEVMAFTLREVPPLFEQMLELSGKCRDDIDALVMHQANQFILNTLGKKLGFTGDKVPSSMRNCGNTSCASIPVTISSCLRERLVQAPMTLAMMGFGVGWSWAGCLGEFGPMALPEPAFLENH